MDIEDLNKRILEMRRDYGNLELLENTTPTYPFDLFLNWFEDSLNENKLDSSAMVLGTVDESGVPDTRVVLLLGLKENSLYFYTSYDSPKGKQIAKNNNASINFFWSYKSRQIRLKGKIEKISRLESEKYFLTRSRGGQLATHGKTQSSIIKDRSDLVYSYKAVEQHFANEVVQCPAGWGGYKFSPCYYEFFQGRNHRLHDRITYTLENGEWLKFRLAP